MILAVASGKGGTGKTTLSVNLAWLLGSGACVLDCDVEEPNAHLFLKGSLREQKTVSIPVPQVDGSRCDACGECSRFCQFNAIVSPKTTPLVFAELCHGCGGCALVCPLDAIRETDHRIGVVETLDAGGVTLIEGRLDVGVAAAAPLIREVRAYVGIGAGTIIDAPPGTSCPVVAALRGSDFVLLITEPTPFGLHDLKLAVEMVRELQIPFGVVVNRVGIGDDRVHAFCEREDIAILQEIPDDRRIAEAYCRGDLVVEALPEYRGIFEGLLERVMELSSTAGA
jgi:MinD superfamily P-loop ATPase